MPIQRGYKYNLVYQDANPPASIARRRFRARSGSGRRQCLVGAGPRRWASGSRLRRFGRGHPARKRAAAHSGTGSWSGAYHVQLRQLPRDNPHLGADRAAVDPLAQPVAGVAAIVAQQRRRLVVVGHDHIEVAVVVVVSHRRAAAHLPQRQAGSQLVADLRVASRTVVAEDLVLLFVGDRIEEVDIVIEVPVGDEKVAVAVVVDKQRAPRQVL